MDEIMLKVTNVSKQYKLGQIGGTTLQEELQRLGARLRRKEDPTRKIGAKDFNRGETFMALNGVSFEVKRGERIGIIGHNGAGKSTLLKLISRVTAPTTGKIEMNGRVASMLEVGTGFHQELTGRENIYMNGAILGMTKREIDSKLEDIIDFSECRQFIDTPVKRYSSGMYVKLAFSVAAHLDSEIMIMDEVLAVGDAKFQKKCLAKMESEARNGKTILYVSHNMTTIRQLCSRCIVLNHGKIVFDGNADTAIQIYQENSGEKKYSIQTSRIPRPTWLNQRAVIKNVEMTGNINGLFREGETLSLIVDWENHVDCHSLAFIITLTNPEGQVVSCTTNRNMISALAGHSYQHCLELNLFNLAPGHYIISIALPNFEEYGYRNFDMLDNIMSFEIESPKEIDPILRVWTRQTHGFVKLPDLKCSELRIRKR